MTSSIYFEFTSLSWEQAQITEVNFRLIIVVFLLRNLIAYLAIGKEIPAMLQAEEKQESILCPGTGSSQSSKVMHMR